MDQPHDSALDSSRRSLITVPLYDYYGVIQLYSHVLAKAACTLGESGHSRSLCLKRSIHRRLPTLCLSLLPGRHWWIMCGFEGYPIQETCMGWPT